MFAILISTKEINKVFILNNCISILTCEIISPMVMVEGGSVLADKN